MDLCSQLAISMGSVVLLTPGCCKQACMSFCQLLGEPEGEACSQAAPAVAPGTQPSFTVSDGGLPELGTSLDEVELDCQGLDDLMWDELGDLDLDVASQPEM